jgi:hypothetical protein
MNLSIETKVAAAVAAGFLAVSVGVVAEGNSNVQLATPNKSTGTIQRAVYWHGDRQVSGEKAATSGRYSQL